jgi:hypothetical protein
MKLAEQIAKHFRQVYFGGNWTSVSMKEILKDVNWREATTQIHSFNTIAALVFHINYYISAVLKVLQGEPLNASDKYSFVLEFKAMKSGRNCWIRPGKMQKCLLL